MLLKEPQSRFEEYYRIYEESFPSKERRTREQQRDILSHPCHRVRIKEKGMESSWWRNALPRRTNPCFWRLNL